MSKVNSYRLNVEGSKASGQTDKKVAVRYFPEPFPHPFIPSSLYFVIPVSVYLDSGFVADSASAGNEASDRLSLRCTMNHKAPGNKKVMPKIIAIVRGAMPT